MTKHETPAPDLSRVRYELELFLMRGGFDLYEDDNLIAAVESGCSEAAFSYGKLILSCWGDGWSRSWRVTGCEAQGANLRLECSRQMGRIRCHLALGRDPSARRPVVSRRDFRSALARAIEASFPGSRFEQSKAIRDDRRHLSGVYARLLVKDRGKPVACIGAGDGESQSIVDGLLGAGLIWLEALRQSGRAVNKLHLFAPTERANTLATRLTAVCPAGAEATLFEFDEPGGTLRPVPAFDQGDLSDNLRRASRRAFWPGQPDISARSAELVEAIKRLAPDLIEISYRRGSIRLSIRGLEFASISSTRARAEYGLGEDKAGLNTTDDLCPLVSRIVAGRTAGPPDPNAIVFRSQSERWLESIIQRDARAVDPALDPRFVYSQVPAYRGEKRGFIDLLCVNDEGRLVVMELKTSEDVEFPFQGLDYWLRVEWHRLRGDFLRRGFFRGVELADLPPLLYLVAPLFRFHETTGLLAKSISGRVPVYRICINENWRAGVRVLSREKMN